MNGTSEHLRIQNAESIQSMLRSLYLSFLNIPDLFLVKNFILHHNYLHHLLTFFTSVYDYPYTFINCQSISTGLTPLVQKTISSPFGMAAKPIHRSSEPSAMVLLTTVLKVALRPQKNGKPFFRIALGILCFRINYHYNNFHQKYPSRYFVGVCMYYMCI